VRTKDGAPFSLSLSLSTFCSAHPPRVAADGSDEYWENRQEVLMAIHRAVKSHRIQYAYSSGVPPPYRDGIGPGDDGIGSSSMTAGGSPQATPRHDDDNDNVARRNSGAATNNATILPSS
jgi:hypothetical protein